MNRAASFDEVAALLSDGFEGVIRRDHSLARSTTYRLGGPAALYVEPTGPGDVDRLAVALKSAGIEAGTVPIVALGRGSNLVVADDGVPGVVIRMGPKASWIKQGARPGGVEGGAAAALPQLANWAARRALTGMEWAVAIPGSVGGAIRMNAGAYEGEVADVLASASVFDLRSLVLEERQPASLGFRYRRSNLGEHHLVVAATFELQPGDEGEIRGLMETYRKHRADTQPGGANNAGSVFKNPQGDSAGRLIEAAGLKGARSGGVEVSKIHANFFVARRGARAQDVYDLLTRVRAVVLDRFGIELEPEIRFVGSFQDTKGPA